MYLLTYIKPNSNIPIILCERITVQLLQIERKKFIATGKYRSGKIQIRTKEGFKNKKIL